MNSAQRLAANVRRRREELGLTQAELCKRSGFALAQVSRFERGVGVTLTTLDRLAKALRVTAAELLS